jgi:curli biogenesis system outer membrane secretion channel CsgG
MIRFFLSFFLLLSFCLGNTSLYAQQNGNSKIIVGVAKFTSEVNTPFVAAVTENVVKVLTNTKRFAVVDRTSYDKIKEELELQKSEAFIDSKSTVKQDVALGAQFLIVGHIVKMNIYTMKNSDGSVNGYKSSAAFTLKVNNVETGETTEAEHFQTEVSPIAASKEQAINQALQSIEKELTEYFKKTFPVYAKIVRIQESKNQSANVVLLNVGKNSDISVGSHFIVDYVDYIEGKAFPTKIGALSVKKLIGEDFSECKVQKGGEEILSRFNAAQILQCKFIEQ